MSAALVMLAPAADATELLGTVTSAELDTTFDIASNGGAADAWFGPGYIDFAITNESSGNGLTIAVFGDAMVGNSFGLGYNLEGVEFGTDFTTPIYDGSSPSSFSLQPGFYTNGFDGGLRVTLTLAAVPEPGSWALMLIGLGGLGATVRVARSRRATAVA